MQPVKYKIGTLFFLLVLSLTLPCRVAFSAAAPSNQSIYLEADQVDIDDKQGVSTYTGKVKMTRAELQIEADKMTVYRSKQQLQKIIAVGTPVQLHQAATASSKEIHGEGLRMEYDAISGEILLSENAKLHQEENDFSGNFIRYNLNSEIVKAGKGETQNQRVRVVIHPKEAPKTTPSTPP